MIRFKDYLWQRIRKPMWTSWFLLVLLSICAYTAFVIFLKNKQLDSSLDVAAYTVNQAIQAGDWSLALGHLRAVEKAGPTFEITLRDLQGTKNVSGPFGEHPFGIGTVCHETKTGGLWGLRGCMRIFGTTELLTLLLFVFFSILMFAIAFKIFRSKSMYFIDKISDELDEMQRNVELGDRDGEQPISEIAAIRRHIMALRKQTERVSRERAFNELSVQVAHDIRSPLAALDAFLTDLPQIHEKKRVMLRSAITRIRDIANNLLEQNQQLRKRGKKADVKSEEELLFPLLDSIVSEKRFQYRRSLGVEIELCQSRASYGIFSRIQRAEFKRVISNLVDNAVESLNGKGAVKIDVSSTSGNAIITVTDNGCGLPDVVLPKLMRKGASYRKSGGSGRGLYHAKTMVSNWGGKITITSTEGKGTTVSMSLPQVEAPNWFVGELQVPINSKLVIVDDDTSIHQIWASRMDSLSAKSRGIRLLHFNSLGPVRKWFKANKEEAQTAKYLIDYELLGQDVSGLDLIEKLGIVKQSILVTSLYEDDAIRSRCEKLGVPLIPKGLAGFVPIMLLAPDSVLIDDDPLVHTLWKDKAEMKGRKLTTFFSVQEFLKKGDSLDREATIFVDSNLGDGHKGEEEAESIYEMGFRDIFLVTGYPNFEIENQKWIRGVRGKDAPF